MAEMRRFPGPPDRLGESPRWNPDTGRIEWIDILDETESSSKSDGSDLVRKALPGEPAGFAYRATGGRVMSLHHGLALRDESGKTQQIPVPNFDVESEWFNDCAWIHGAVSGSAHWLSTFNLRSAHFIGLIRISRPIGWMRVL